MILHLPAFEVLCTSHKKKDTCVRMGVSAYVCVRKTFTRKEKREKKKRKEKEKRKRKEREKKEK